LAPAPLTIGGEAVPAAIACLGVTKRYGRTLALSKCDLTVPEGTFCALVGANGAGKSTLLMALIGLVRPTSGTLLVFGLAPRLNRQRTLSQIGFVAQDRPLYRSLSVRETMEFGRRTNERWDSALVTSRLDRLRIPIDRRVDTLSGGQQAQVALTLALGKTPRMLVLDEPVANLDPKARQEFLDDVASLSKRQRLTVLMSSHIIAELSRISDHLVVLRRGEVRFCGRVTGPSLARGAHGESRASTTPFEETVLSLMGEDQETT